MGEYAVESYAKHETAMNTATGVSAMSFPMTRHSRRRRRLIICVSCSIIIGFFLLPFIWEKFINAFSPWNSSEREFIVKELNSVISDLHKHAQHQEWSAKTEQKLLRMLNIFSRRNDPFDFKNIDASISKSDSPFPVICPETYLHFNLSEPYYLKGSWEKIKDCKDQSSVEQLLTIALIPRINDGNCGENIRILLKTISSYNSKIPVVVGVPLDKCSVSSYNQMSVVNIHTDSSSGSAWNTVIKSVSTPYVLIGRDLDFVSWFARFERQLSILTSEPAVKIVGGSFRNRTGHWQIGCLQTSIEHYRLRYEEGYHASKNECIYCDHLSGPFIARTSLFNMVKFDDHLRSDVIFEDFFIRLKQNSILVMNCPDAMYFVHELKTHTRFSWLSLAKKWELNRIALPDDLNFKFSCEDVGMKCSELHPLSGKRFMPTCCMDRLMDGLKALHAFSRKENLLYYINGGTLLGAIKFQNIIPWDFDGDVIYYLSNFTTFQRNNRTISSNPKKIFLDDFNFKWYGYFRIKMPDIFIEMDGLNETANENTGMNTNLFQRVPTMVRIRGEWLYGPPSPGLYVRNMYGREIFRHANSWHLQGHLWFDPYKAQGHFFLCDDPNHHACYDYLSTDGSFCFASP